MKFAAAAVMPSLPVPAINSRRLILPALNASKKSFALSLIVFSFGFFLISFPN
jgi:Sec-independent protein secretion pathway component TatC